MSFENIKLFSFSVSGSPPDPVPIKTPIESESVLLRSSSELFMASLEAAIANCENLANLFAFFASINFEGSKFQTSPPILQEYPSVTTCFK